MTTAPAGHPAYSILAAALRRLVEAGQWPGTEIDTPSIPRTAPRPGNSQPAGAAGEGDTGMDRAA